VILSTHIVEDVTDLCPTMAIIAAGQVRAQGSPDALIERLRGTIWRRRISRDALAAVRAQHRVISTRLIAGAPEIRVHAASSPGDGFVQVEPDLEDVYFEQVTAASAGEAA
jgi:ABC-type multidrug transport system ATPase subunit